MARSSKRSSWRTLARRGARAQALLAWLAEQPRSEARETILRPLRKAVARKHAFSIVVDTV